MTSSIEILSNTQYERGNPLRIPIDRLLQPLTWRPHQTAQTDDWQHQGRRILITIPGLLERHNRTRAHASSHEAHGEPLKTGG